MRYSLKSWATLALTAGFVALTHSARAELVDAVAATVDKEVVLYSELKAEIGSELTNIRRSEASVEDKQKAADNLVRQALEEAINSRLLVREAKKNPQLQVTDKELDVYIEELRKKFDTPEAFVKAVGGSVSEFRERYRQQKMAQYMSVSKMDSFESQVVVS